MQNLQSRIFKIIILLFVNLYPVQNYAGAIDYSRIQARADSLFAVQKYLRSYELYDSIHTVGKLSSPAMLMKMAFIKEGLGDYAMALYHLNEYYIRTSDEMALEKMESLAKAYDLVGYNYSDKEYFISVYHEYYNYLLIVLITLAVIFLAGIIYGKFKQRRKQAGNFVLLAIVSGLLLLLINLGMGFQEGIITHPNTYIMSQPASSAEVLDIVGKGHKIIIDNENDVWLKTIWNDQEAFIKKKNVMQVSGW
ncbi:MAG: hypothetical protein IH947_11960 [Bacteroidetes bacterium]|nr:hypothetical protein [Bacteroidota bacterium]MCH8231203.1 hypothetical protein [Bacteroidota bacterium]